MQTKSDEHDCQIVDQTEIIQRQRKLSTEERKSFGQRNIKAYPS